MDRGFRRSVPRSAGIPPSSACGIRAGWTDGVGDGVDQSRREAGQGAFARFLGAERPIWIVAFDDLYLDRRGFRHRRHAVFEQAGPMALAMALTKAGGKPAKAPSLASLAPNGPYGSWLSTICTSIGGDSAIVGMRYSSRLA